MLREIILLRKLTEKKENIFTIKLVDVILPPALQNVEISEDKLREQLDHVFIVTTPVMDRDLKSLLE